MNKKVVWLPYDFDTALGINNEGALVFSYNLEDTDHLEGGADVFNGQDSVLWNNLRDAFFDDIKAMYQELRSEGKLSYEAVEAAFEEHQNKWSEAIFNEDAYYKYLAPLVDPDGKEPTAAYLPMLQGSKKEQRKWWMYNRFRYMDSKYNAGDALTDVIQLRGYAKDDITVTPYADVYASVKYGSYLVQTRAARNVPVTLLCPIDTLNDTEIYIYSASQLAAIGDLSGLKVGFADFSHGTKLSSLKVGDSDANYSNPNLKTLYVGTNGLLQSIDVRNCTALGTGEQTSVDLSGARNIEHVYFDGTAIKGVSLPNGGVLKTLHLPATVTNLTILNQTAITEFVIPTYGNISTLRLENVSSAVDSKAIFNAIPTNSRVRLIGIHWECDDAAEIKAVMDRLDTMRGLDEHGNNVDKAQVSGTIHTDSITGSQKAEFKARYPYITITADHTSATITYKDAVGNDFYVETVVDNGDGVYAGQPTKSSTAQYTYTFAGWSKEDDGTVDADAVTHVTDDRIVYPCYTSTLRTYTVTWVNADDTVLETDSNVPYGATPTFDGTTPTYDGDTSIGWVPEIASVTGNVTYKAKYTPKYTATFVKASADGGGTLYTVKVKEGQTPVYGGSTPTSSQGSAEDYPFEGWKPELAPIYADTTYTAKFGSPVEVAEITDTWDQIIQHIDAGDYATRYKLGNYKPLDLGTEGTINMQIVGMDVDELANGGYAPLSFIGMELLNTEHSMNSTSTNAGGWEASGMRSYLNNTILPLVPSNVRFRLSSVIKSYFDKTSDSTLFSTDKLWIPSNKEIVNLNIKKEDSGVVYDKIFNSNESRIRKHNNSESVYFVRTANNGSATEFFCIMPSGGFSKYGTASNVSGVCLGFCLGLE